MAKKTPGLITDLNGMKKVREAYGLARQPHTPLHHLKPRSRCANDKFQHSHFNLFPWTESTHAAWHTLFSNMTLAEIWEAVDVIHAQIFKHDKAIMTKPWLTVCEWPKLTPYQRQKTLAEEVSREFLQANWQTAFGSSDLVVTKWFIQYMMLYVVFGTNMIYPHTIFSQPDIKVFINDASVDVTRSWALRALFGKSCSLTRIEKKFKKILKKTRGSHS